MFRQVTHHLFTKMNILLIFYTIFIVVYLIFNAYAIYRMNKIRIKGDITGVVTFIYALAIIFIIFITFIVAGNLSWGPINFKEIF